MSTRPPYLFWVICACALLPEAARAGDPIKPAAANTAPVEAPPDDELIEFLGSVDNDDKDWLEYLAKTDIAKVAKTAATQREPEVKKDE